jgi:hypothetical protein
MTTIDTWMDPTVCFIRRRRQTAIAVRRETRGGRRHELLHPMAMENLRSA